MSDALTRVHSVSARQTYEIRKAVLWPNKPIESQGVDTDDHGIHYGVTDDAGNVIAVISVAYDVPFPDTAAMESNHTDQRTARVRKFATLPSHQGKGVGSALISHAISETKKTDFQLIWLDARASSVEWYRRRGWRDVGETFQRGDDGQYVRMIYGQLG